MFMRLTIVKKLAIGVGALVALLVVLSIISLRVIATLGTSLDVAVNTTGRKLDLVARTREAFQDLKTGSLRSQVSYAIGEMERSSTASGKGQCSVCHAPSSIGDSVHEVEAAGEAVKQRSRE